MQNYKTVLRASTAEFTEKRSRFIANVSPVQNEEEALSFLSKIKAEHREARHNVYAYVCRENNISRFSDDGEPSGTAGLPVLNALLGKGITDACIVVTRYFGGILLGAGGLARAYGKSAGDGILAAGICEMIDSSIFSVTLDYPLLGKIQHVIEQQGYQILDTEFGVMPSLSVCTEKERGNELIKTLTDATGGKISITAEGSRFCARPLSAEDI